MTLISRVTLQSMFISQPIEVLHKRLTHLDIQDVKKLVSITTGIKIKNNYMPDICRGCVDEKHSWNVSHESETWAKNPCKLMHVDLIGPITPTKYNDHKYVLILTDDYFRASILQTMISKNEVKKILVKVYMKIQNQINHMIKWYCTDLEGEFVNRALKKWSKQEDIHWEFTTPCTPEQDKVSECTNHTVKEKLCSLFAESSLSKKLWSIELQTVIQLKNKSPTETVKRKTLYEAFYDTPPDLSKLWIFDCTVYIHIPKENQMKSDKFTFRTCKCVFIDYKSSS